MKKLFLKQNKIDYELILSDQDITEYIYVWNNIPNNFSIEQLSCACNNIILTGKTIFSSEDIDKTPHCHLTIFGKNTDEIINLVDRVINTLT